MSLRNPNTKCKACDMEMYVHPNHIRRKTYSGLCRDCWLDTTNEINNGMWRGNNVGYVGLHRWIIRHLSKPNKCQKCNVNPAIDCANKSGKYLRDLSDWEWLCRRCHMLSDGRMGNLKQYATK